MIEDDEEITILLKQYLPKYSMEVIGVTTPSEGIDLLKKDSFDLIILDLSLPEMDGLEVCRLIREKYDIPIVISTARSDLTDKVTGLSLGADDYLPKPYDPRELVARIQTILRRTIKQTKDINNKNEFEIDIDKMLILKDKRPLDLTLAEYEILKIFIEKKEMVISREYIANTVNALQWDSSDRSIDVIISRIRHKLGDNSKNPKYIKSIRGVGYKFIAQ